MLPWIIGLTAIGAAAIALLYVGIWYGSRVSNVVPYEPIEHGDGEP